MSAANESASGRPRRAAICPCGARLNFPPELDRISCPKCQRVLRRKSEATAAPPAPPPAPQPSANLPAPVERMPPPVILDRPERARPVVIRERERVIVRERVRKSRLAYILLGLFLGGLGVHNFYAGRTSQGTTQLLLNLAGLVQVFLGVLLSCLWLPIVLVFTGALTCLAVGVWALVEIIIVDRDGRGREMA